MTFTTMLMLGTAVIAPSFTNNVDLVVAFRHPWEPKHRVPVGIILYSAWVFGTLFITILTLAKLSPSWLNLSLALNETKNVAVAVRDVWRRLNGTPARARTPQPAAAARSSASTAWSRSGAARRARATPRSRPAKRPRRRGSATTAGIRARRRTRDIPHNRAADLYDAFCSHISTLRYGVHFRK